MIILDTNVVSEPTKPLANPNVAAWINRQDRRSMFLTAISLAELMEGVAILPDGKRKQAMRLSVDKLIAELIVRPILPFDRRAAYAYASLFACAKAKKYTPPIADAQIAAIAAVHGFTVATRDVEPFRAAGVAVINPWTE